jgi:hypothetical protein
MIPQVMQLRDEFIVSLFTTRYIELVAILFVPMPMCITDAQYAPAKNHALLLLLLLMLLLLVLKDLTLTLYTLHKR